MLNRRTFWQSPLPPFLSLSLPPCTPPPLPHLSPRLPIPHLLANPHRPFHSIQPDTPDYTSLDDDPAITKIYRQHDTYKFSMETISINLFSACAFSINRSLIVIANYIKFGWHSSCVRNVYIFQFNVHRPNGIGLANGWMDDWLVDLCWIWQQACPLPVTAQQMLMNQQNDLKSVGFSAPNRVG